MINKNIDTLQDLALEQKGLSLLSEVYRQFKNENTKLFTSDELDAIECFLSASQITYAKNIKAYADKLK